MTRELWLSFVVLGSVVGMACDSSQPKEPQPESGLSNTAPYTAGEIKALLLEGASEEQIEALRDDFVTAAEYERAMLAMARCMTEQGIVFQEEPLGRRNSLSDTVLVHCWRDARGCYGI